MKQLPDLASEVDAFISRWESSGANERANYVQFLTELCDLLGVSQPDPSTANTADNAYVFERDVTFDQGDGTTTTGRIDLYKRGCFVLEAKQGSDQERAEEQAARALASPTAKKTTKKKGTAVRGTKNWNDAMVKARGQAEAYAKALPAGEGWPPFLIVVDEFSARHPQFGLNAGDEFSLEFSQIAYARDAINSLVAQIDERVVTHNLVGADDLQP